MRRPARASGSWPRAPIGPGPTSSSSRKILATWSAAIELRKCASARASRIGRPGDVGPGRPFAESAFESARHGACFVGRLEWWVNQDDSAPLLRRQVGVERDIAVGADYAKPPIAPERNDQSLAFVRVRFAERDAILRPREALSDRRRTGIRHWPAIRIMRADGLQIGAQKLRNRRGRAPGQNTRDPVAPFRRALRLVARQIEATRPGMGVDEPEGAFLSGQINENARPERRA